MSEEKHTRALRTGVEGASTGLAYAGALAAVSVFLVGSFRPTELPLPYWGRIAWLRTDTFGFSCVIVAVFAYVQSEYLRVSRGARSERKGLGDPKTITILTLVTARVCAVAGSVLVAYLSINEVTHPQTLALTATHLLAWPTEATLRVVALVVTACAVAVARVQRILMSEG
jgi:hypothetical protein